MNNFIEKNIIEDNHIGRLIYSERKKSPWKIEEISRKLGIKIDYLKAIESDRFDLLPDGLYGKNFFKKYAEFLKIDKKLINQKIHELSEERKDNPFSSQKIKRHDFIVFPKIVRNVIFIIIVLMCSLYLAFYAKKIFSPPELIINYPENNLLTKEKSITIKGEIEKEAELKINGELVLGDSDGLFEKEINLKSGLNNISIRAKKKYSRENIITREILVEE